MAKILNFQEFKERKERENQAPDFESLEWAKSYLDDDYDNAFSWSLEELRTTIERAKSYPTMACEAYTLIYEYRTRSL